MSLEPPEDPSARATLARRALWTLGAIAFTTLLLSMRQHAIGPAPLALALAFLLFAAIRPYDALLTVAAVGPVSIAAYGVVRTGTVSLRFEEAIVLACLAGWSARLAIQPRRLAVQPLVRWSAALLLLAAATGTVVAAAELAARNPATPAGELLVPLIFKDYLANVNEFSSGVLMIESALLLLVTADLCSERAERPAQILRLMVLGTAAAALLNFVEVGTEALGREQPWATFVRYLRTIRLNTQYSDLNAAGSYFAMMLFPAVALATRWRIAGSIAAVLIVGALWLTGSRTALGATLLVAFAGVLAVLYHRRMLRVTTVAGVLILAVALGAAAWKWYPQSRSPASGRYAMRIRVEMGAAGLQLAREAPIFGVGPGRFRELSAKYAELPENAHNNFIQVLAEYGTVGLVLFVVVVLSSLAGFRREQDAPPAALVCGIAVYLVTCVAGHPLLVPAAAYPFWLALGLATAPAGAGAVSSSRRLRIAAGALLGLLIATVPYRIVVARRNADIEHVSIGFSAWQRGAEGERYRWAGGRSTFFVPASARAVRIPLRRGAEAPDPVQVRVFLDGREAAGIMLQGTEGWRTLRLVLVRTGESAFRRIELEAVAPGTLAPLEGRPTNTTGLLMVGRPAVEH